MTSFKLLLAELSYRRANFAMSLLAVTVATMLFVVGPTLVDGYGRETELRVAKLEKETTTELQRLQAGTNEELARMEDETTKLMRDMGFNLLIVHVDTNMNDFWAADFSAVDMPQEYVARLANAKDLSLVEHLVAMLQQKIEWQDRKVLLAGYLPEAVKTHSKKKSPMGYDIKLGTVFVGHELAAERAVGDKIEILGKSFEIARILPEQGSKEDITLAIHLSDAQALLNKSGQVNQIMALGCRCSGERLPQIRAQLAKNLPETKITEFRSIAVARAEERDMIALQRKTILDQAAAKQALIVTELANSRQQTQAAMASLAGVLIPVVVVACGIWIGLLALMNVRQRASEIGLLRALGRGSLQIAVLLLGKAALIGLLGGLLGFGISRLAAAWLGRLPALEISADQLVPGQMLVLAALIGAPLLSVLASYLPTLSATMQDPAQVLRET